MRRISKSICVYLGKTAWNQKGGCILIASMAKNARLSSETKEQVFLQLIGYSVPLNCKQGNDSDIHLEALSDEKCIDE